MTKLQKVLLLGLGVPVVYWSLWYLILCLLSVGTLEAFVFVIFGSVGLGITALSSLWIWITADVDSIIDGRLEELKDWINKEE